MTPKKDEYMRGYGDAFKEAKELLGAALTEIRDRHIPDCPAHFAGSEQDWVERQYIALRRIAREALEANPALRQPSSEAKCMRCKGTGTVADYVGDDMRCIETACPDCDGTGRASRLRAVSQP